jgi:hypothetical protein
MSQTRIYSVIQDATHDESHEFTRISFDNREAAEAFIDAVHKREYEHYVSDHDTWAKDRDGNWANGWVLDPSGAFLTRKGERGSRTLRSYLPPPPVDYERWLKSDFTLIPGDYYDYDDNRDPGMVHTYDQMHAPTGLRVEEDWLYGSVPSLVYDRTTVRTTDEQRRMEEALSAILAP